MSEENKTEEEEVVEEAENVTEEVVVEETISTTADSSSDNVTLSVTGEDGPSRSIGTGRIVYNGSCKLCGKRIANALISTDGKVNCLSCKGSF